MDFNQWEQRITIGDCIATIALCFMASLFAISAVIKLDIVDMELSLCLGLMLWLIFTAIGLVGLVIVTNNRMARAVEEISYEVNQALAWSSKCGCSVDSIHPQYKCDRPIPVTKVLDVLLKKLGVRIVQMDTPFTKDAVFVTKKDTKLPEDHKVIFGE
ncbi:MAG: hypothetical protein PVG39_04680 [Desulfobacteraceae bacterium]|jgi:hypothetical protein